MFVGFRGRSFVDWWSLGCRCWCDSRGIRVVIGHRDYSLTLIVCDSRRSSVIGLIGSQGIGYHVVVLP